MLCFLKSTVSIQSREKDDQILEIKRHRIKSIKIHQLKFNFTNQISLEISCEQLNSSAKLEARLRGLLRKPNYF